MPVTAADVDVVITAAVVVKLPGVIELPDVIEEDAVVVRALELAAVVPVDRLSSTVVLTAPVVVVLLVILSYHRPRK